MKKDNLDEYVSKISNVLTDKIQIITSIEYHYDLEKLISFTDNLSNEEVEEILEQLINDRLEEIKKCTNEEQIKENNKLVDEVTEFFYESVDDSVIAEEGSCIASDLILKVLGVNGRKIEMPIKISFIKEYCISNIIEEKDIRKTLLWIVLELSTVSYFLKNKTITSK